MAVVICTIATLLIQLIGRTVVRVVALKDCFWRCHCDCVVMEESSVGHYCKYGSKCLGRIVIDVCCHMPCCLVIVPILCVVLLSCQCCVVIDGRCHMHDSNMVDSIDWKDSRQGTGGKGRKLIVCGVQMPHLARF